MPVDEPSGLNAKHITIVFCFSSKSLPEKSAPSCLGGKMLKVPRMNIV